MNIINPHKLTELHNLFEQFTKQNLFVAFSGGADSSLLLKLACEHAKNHQTTVYAVTANTRLHPKGDLSIAQNVAKEMGATHLILSIDELNEANLQHNPKNRCYLCKRAIFSKIRSLAEEYGIQTVLEGTNYDDLHTYRPGLQAVRELDICSPLADLGITKNEVRILLADYAVSTADRPSTPCLATRIPYGASLDYSLLERIESAESELKKLGFYNLRLRIHGSIARIEVDISALDRLLHHREAVIRICKQAGFHYVTCDIEGFRSGSMDEV